MGSHDDCTITFPKKDWKLIKKALASLGMTGTFVTLTPVLAQIAGILETIDKELNESSHSNDSGTREEVQ